jgi:hypothetical protein
MLPLWWGIVLNDGNTGGKIHHGSPFAGNKNTNPHHPVSVLYG